MKNIIVSSEDNIRQILAEIVEQSISNKIPEIVKKATRKEHLTIEEVCEALDISRRHLQYLRDSGQISFVQNGRKIYFRAEDLDAFFKNNYVEKEA